ncbi:MULTISPECIES: cation transporter [unclassified Agarivorans]|uniref:cation transporter n=1 Tax=unclassified Agarivorans TaxID=2636026 RepID=UPI0026E3AB0B|nr:MULTISPECIES: cation transporter [unclassified Agarivorans]MDO6686809.1 cation transporter [Agarivorans sp. 3_MG-2023]MDO6716461.1 cation transporter [Agarivorans sp. 2_MG-2023]
MDLERKTLVYSAVIALILSLWGIAMGVHTESGAIMLDGVFNLLSSVMAFTGIRIAYLTSQNYNERFPMGYFAFEPLMVMVKGISILVLVAFALSANLQTMLAGGREPQIGMMLIYVVPAVSGCLLAWWICLRSNKLQASNLLLAEQQGWLINSVISGAIGIALIVVLLIQDSSVGWIARYVDQILVIVFSLIFLKDPYLLVKNGFKELLLSAPEPEHTKPFTQALEQQTMLNGFELGEIVVMKTGRRFWVTIEVVCRNHQLALDDMVQQRKQIRSLANQYYQNNYTEIVFVEPSEQGEFSAG